MVIGRKKEVANGRGGKRERCLIDRKRRFRKGKEEVG